MPSMYTVKDCVSAASMEIGIAQTPIDTVLGSLDQDVVQMGMLLQVVADELLEDEPYKFILGDGNWLMDGVTSEPKDRITSDLDILLFNGRLAIAGLKYRFLKAKGLEFGEEMRDFTVRLNKIAASTGRVLDLDSEGSRVV